MAEELPHQCEECGDEGSLYLQARCHKYVPPWAVLSGDVLTFECSVCAQVVARFIVNKIVEER
jgi:hypothetical protein